ncbi:hypothetical protein [Streptomyces sp. NPDC053560]|uniref:hypothetical protein n=1 Tax=Streptomyces sp. NPDC053560 TaxID=3365711 RepID=UPI0037D24EBC
MRKQSLNAAVLRTAAELCAPPHEVRIAPSVDRLPFSEQDVEEAGVLPPAVAELRERAGAARGSADRDAGIRARHLRRAPRGSAA